MGIKVKSSITKRKYNFANQTLHTDSLKLVAVLCVCSDFCFRSLFFLLQVIEKTPQDIIFELITWR